MTSFSSDFIATFTPWAPCLPYPEAQEFFEKFYDRFGSFPDYHGAQAYVSIQVIANAISRAESNSGDHIRDALIATRLDSLYGPVNFVPLDDGSFENNPLCYVVRWQEGRLRLIWPHILSSIP